MEDVGDASFAVTKAWLDENLAVADRAGRSGADARLNHAEIWTSGLTRTQTSAFETQAPDRTVGAKLQPFQDLKLRIGTQVSRSGTDPRSVSSTANWEAFWAQDPGGAGAPSVQLSTSGSLADWRGGYSQSFTGTLALPLDLPIRGWNTQVQFSPNMALDLANRSLGTALMSEVVGQTMLSARGNAYRSELNVRLGYGVAADQRPSASAMLEFRVSPNL